ADAMASEGVAKVANTGAASSHEHVAAGHLELADDRLGQLGAPGADQAVQAEDLSPVEAEGDAARPRLGGEVSHLEHRLAACRERALATSTSCIWAALRAETDLVAGMSSPTVFIQGRAYR